MFEIYDFLRDCQLLFLTDLGIGMLESGFKIFCRFNIKRQSKAIQQIRNPKSKIAPKSRLNGIKTG